MSKLKNWKKKSLQYTYIYKKIESAKFNYLKFTDKKGIYFTSQLSCKIHVHARARKNWNLKI